MTSTFPYKRQPFPYQREALRKMVTSLDRFALLMEPGTGKSMVTIVNAAWMYANKLVDGMVVIAPRGAHTNWVRDEVPIHWPNEYPLTSFAWDSARAQRPAYKAALKAFLQNQTPFAILVVNIDAVRLPRCIEVVKAFTSQRRCVGVVDESADIASPSSTRGRRVRAMAAWFPYRRILDGTPWAESPFELYGQFKFLGHGIVGATTYMNMKRAYGEWEKVILRAGTATTPERSFPKLIRYRQLDKLASRIAPYSYRITQAEAMPFLPDRTYTKIRFPLSPEHQAIYDQLESEFLVEFGDGCEVEAAHQLVRMVRLQQITCGYVPTRTWGADPEDEPEPSNLMILGGDNARLAALRATLVRYPGPTIIWTRFIQDTPQVLSVLRDLGKRVAVYAGSDSQQTSAKEAFQSGTADIFLSNTRAGGRSLTLTRARYMIHYSHYFGLRTRLQSDDRFYRHGLDHPVTVFDLIADNTIDERIVESHRQKRAIADLVSGDNPDRAWI